MHGVMARLLAKSSDNTRAMARLRLGTDSQRAVGGISLSYIIFCKWPRLVWY